MQRWLYITSLEEHQISDRGFLVDSDADDDGNDDGDEEFSAPPLTTSSDMTSIRDFIRDQIIYYSRDR